MKKVLTSGEIMMRLSPPGFQRFSQAGSFDVVYGAGESNEAVSLANFGIPVEFVTRLRKNDLGDCAHMEMRKRGVGVTCLLQGGQRLGINSLETDAVSRGSKVISDREHSSIGEIKPGMIPWEQDFNGGRCFPWTGITPASSRDEAGKLMVGMPPEG